MTQMKNDLVGSVWYEKARPGHLVVIVGVRPQNKLVIRHIGVYKVRAQSYPSLISQANFKARYRRKES